MSDLASETVDLQTVEQLIDSFRTTDLELAIAIDSEQGQDVIRQAAVRVDASIENLFTLPCDGTQESRMLYRFLVKRFVLDENASHDLRRRVCENLLNRS